MAEGGSRPRPQGEAGKRPMAERAATTIASHDAPSHVTCPVLIKASPNPVASPRNTKCHCTATEMMGGMMGSADRKSKDHRRLASHLIAVLI